MLAIARLVCMERNEGLMVCIKSSGYVYKMERRGAGDINAYEN